MKIMIDLTSVFDQASKDAKEAARPQRPKKNPRKKVKKNTIGDDLTMRLMAIGGGSDESAVQLEFDVVAHIESLLASGKKRNAVEFLNNNKHRFTPDMKDSLTDVINKGI